MPLITLQFGQCGNQLGYELNSVIRDDIESQQTGVSNYLNKLYCELSVKNWFHIQSDGSCFTRTVAVDTENKVISDIQKRTRNSDWTYNINSIVTNNSGGCSNNWAVGYNRKGPQLISKIISAVRRECESCDNVKGFLGISSCAGGTGSGVGSYVLERLEDEFPHKNLVSVLVSPYSSGDVVIQNYNTLLTISKMYDVSDAIIVFQNDYIHKVCANLLNIRNIEYHNLNNVIAQQLASLYQPVLENDCIETVDFSDFISHLTPHPSFKILSMKTAPHVEETFTQFESMPSWELLESYIMRTLKSVNSSEEVIQMKMKTVRHSEHYSYDKCVSNLLIRRGCDAVISREAFSKSFNIRSLYASWIPKNYCFVHYNQNRKFLNKDRFLTLISNNSSIHPYLDKLVKSAWETYNNNAFVYQYSKHDVTKEDFLQAFSKIENILKEYKSI